MAIKDFKTSEFEKKVIDAYNKVIDVQEKLNASVTIIDPSEQLEALHDVDANGLLYGVPIALKDNINVKGIRTTASSKILDDYIPVYNAHIVDKLKKAGAILVSKTSLDELAMGGTNLSASTGPVNNPYDLNRISGGSSGGSAVLVASGCVPVAIGSDTGDSIRKPASYNNIVGVKPTYGRISRYGIIPYASSLDHVGYFTNNVSDAAIVLEVLAGRDDRDMTSSNKEVPSYSKEISNDVKNKKICILGNVYDYMEENELKASFDNVCDGLKEKGAIVEKEYIKKELAEAILPVYFIISNCEASANDSNLDGIRFGLQEGDNSYEEIMTKTRTKGFTSLIRKRFIIGSYGLFDENQEHVLRKAQKARRLIVDDLHRLLNKYDAIIAPASLNGAPLKNETNDEVSTKYMVAENYMAIANFSGDPSMTVPFTMLNGLPVGINITTKAFDEINMFNIGLAIEDITGIKDVVKEV